MKHYIIHIEEINGDTQNKETFIVNQYEKDKIVTIAKDSKEEIKED